MTSDIVLLEKYTSHFIWKGCVWEGVGDWTELQHIDPHSIGHNRVSFPFSCAAQPGAWMPSLSGTYSSIQHLSNCNYSIGGSRAHSAGCWLSLPHLVSNWSGLQTNWLPVLPSYIIVQRPLLLLVGVTIALIQPILGQGYNSDISRPDVPVIHIGTFPILSDRPGRRSIYNTNSYENHFP